jgi:outer membrane protein
MSSNVRLCAGAVSAALALAILAGGSSGAFAAPAAPAPAPAAGPAVLSAPRIIVIDRQFIAQRSSAGRDIMTQYAKMNSDAETEFRGEESKLQSEGQQLQQQLAILAPDVRDQKEKDFTAKETSLQQRAQQRQAQIQQGLQNALATVEKALNPILQDIMRERSANILLDRSAVILVANEVDVTPVAIQRLDKVLPHVKLELAKLPAPAAAATAPPKKK